MRTHKHLLILTGDARFTAIRWVQAASGSHIGDKAWPAAKSPSNRFGNGLFVLALEEASTVMVKEDGGQYRPRPVIR